MTITYQNNALLVSERVDEICSLLPQAKKLIVDGMPVAALRHRLEYCQVLTNMGLVVKSPIRTEYDFPGGFKPYAHQLSTAEFLTLNLNAFVLNDPGTGKTASAIWAVDYLRKAGRIGSVLIVSPLSTLRSVWQKEIFNLTPGIAVGLVVGTPVQRKAILADRDNKIFVINHDGIKTVEAELIKHPDITHVILDECTAFKTPGSQRFKTFKRIMKNRTLWAMTGTPVAQSPADAWTMCSLIAPHRVPSSHKRFVDMVMRQVSDFKYVPRPNAAEVVNKAMQPAIRFAKADCLDLPPIVRINHGVELTDEQKHVARKIMDEWRFEDKAAGTEVTAQNAAIRVSKLRQVYLGTVLDSRGQPVFIGAPSRIAACRDFIESSASKTIIFMPFKASMDYWEKELGQHYDVCRIDGDVSGNSRQKIIDSFQDDPYGPQVLIAHPKTAAHGLTLTAASTTIWAGPIYSVEEFVQANNRTDRPGQKHVCRVVHLGATTVEWTVYSALQRGVLDQNTVLSLYENIT